MLFIDKVGNISIYTEHDTSNTTIISLINGNEIIFQETYLNYSTDKAIEDAIQKAMNAYTAEWLYLNASDLKKIKENTYKSGKEDYFCRIDNTRFFAHLTGSAGDFIKGKDGKRIIDR